MKTRSRFLRFPIACLVVLSVVAQVPASAAGPGWQRHVERQLDSIVETGVPGAMVFAQEEPPVWITSGEARLRRHVPMRPELRYRIGSETKTFVAVVMLQLVQEGVLTLDDTVEQWLPGMVPNGDAMTVRMLLNHTSGLFNYTEDRRVIKPYLEGDYEFVWTPEELVEIATSHDPTFPPGTDWSYSNTGYIVLGLIAEKATGATLSDLLTDRVFEPLGLADTSLPSGPAVPSPRAHGYLLPGKGAAPLDITRFSPSWAWAAGAIVSDGDDVAAFYGALMRGELLGPEMMAELKSGVDIGGGAAYGLGLLWIETPCGTAWGHDGLFPGYLSIALATEDGSRVVTVTINGTGALRRAAFRAFEEAVVTAFCGERVTKGRGAALLPIVERETTAIR